MRIKYLLPSCSVLLLTTHVAQAEPSANLKLALEELPGKSLRQSSAKGISQRYLQKSQLTKKGIIPQKNFHNLSSVSHSSKEAQKKLSEVFVDKPLIDFSSPNYKADLPLSPEISAANQPLRKLPQLKTQIPVASKTLAKEQSVSKVFHNSEITPISPTKITEPKSVDWLEQMTAEQLDVVNSLDEEMEQVNNVYQLRDVQPTDWAFEALRNLVERYGCIAGYPNGTFRGNRALSRSEFAAGLNACLQEIERLLAEANSVPQEDLAKIARLMKDFEAELATLATRVDNLEGRVAFLEDNQFSTTTIMNGEVIFALADAFGGNQPGGCRDISLTLQNSRTSDVVDCRGDVRNSPDTNTILANLTRLGLQTSFTGKDRLRTYLSTGNFDNGGFTQVESLNTYMSRFGFQAGLENQVIVDLVEYRFPIFDDRVVISAIPFGFSLSDVLTSNSPYFDIGRGSISRFGQLSPIFRIGGVLDAGVGFDWLISENARLQVAYGTGDSGDPEQGFFGSDHSSLGVQFLLQPFKNLVTGITYVNSYNSDGVLGTFTGSVNAETNGLWSGGRLPDSGLNAFPGKGVEIGDFPAQTNAVGATLQWRITENLTFGASAAYTFTNFLKEIPEFGGDGDPRVGNPRVAGEKPFGNTVTYLFSLGLSDPFSREGDLFAFLVGMPPKLVNSGPTAAGQSVPFSEQIVRDENPVTVTDNDPRTNPVIDPNNGDPENDFLRPEGTAQQFGREDEATSIHFEVFYRFKVTDNIWITPGFFVVTNPGHIKSNSALFVGTIRTTFRF